MNPRENYISLLQEDQTPEIQSLAKEMEKKFWSDLQERLDEVKQHPLPYHYQAPELVWKSLVKATNKDFESSPVTAIDKKQFKILFDHIMSVPSGFKPLKK